MNSFIVRGTLALALIAISVGSVPAAANHGDQAAADAWAAQHFTGDAPQVPFSFKYGDISSADLLKRSKFQNEEKQLDPNRVQRTLTWADPETKLEVRCVAIQYKDSPFIEWTLHFTNQGDKDTPILSGIRAVDFASDREGDRDPVLHHFKGSRATPDDFKPRTTSLDEGLGVHLRSIGGRGTDGTMPYFNIVGPGKGLLLAIGWPGQWDIQFTRNIGVNLHIAGGQEQTHFKLLPSETVRSPLIALGFYTGDPQDGQNGWRRWMIAHNLPRVHGALPPTQLVACSSHQFSEMINANEENQKHFVDRYVDEKLGIAYWWMDAGWYPNDGSWVNTGTWEVDRKRFPNGLRAVTDHARSKGVKAIVWFEPERVTAGTWLYEKHPEWLLTPPPNPGDQLYDPNWRLLNLGNPDALAWLIGHINKIIDEEGIDLYRQDFNVSPLMFWRASDAPDRQGIAEIKYVTGYLAFWDALLAQNRSLRIDNCASGGRRLDLESLRRSVPLLRSDYLFEPIGQQCHTYGINQWIPYHGTGTSPGKSAIGLNTADKFDPYDFRSQMVCSLTAAWDMRRNDLDYDELRRLTSQFRDVAPNFLGDYYPLIPYSCSAAVWMAWQYDRPERGMGIVQAFRRDESTSSVENFRMEGLNRDANYLVRNVDTNEEILATGTELMNKGLKIELTKPHMAALFVYKEQE